jgi:gamma-glutamyltranspeptidase/glutathione hydrolase
MRRPWLLICLFAISLLCASPAAAAPDVDALDAKTVTSDGGVVAADQPVASKIGARILAQGGNAADAGVATLLALGVVNPFSSGLGGGGFCLYRPASTGEVTVLDFRETAPAAATADMYVVDGEVKEDWMVRGGKSVGVPGEPGGLWALNYKFGSQPWETLVDPAYTLASEGYSVHQLLVDRLERGAEKLKKRPKLAAAFQEDDGSWVDTGDTLKRPGLARTLKTLRDEGPAPFYEGPIADAIVDAVNQAGGIFSEQDLASYSIKVREPVQGTYRGKTVFSMPPSSSGGTAIIETLNILEGYEMSRFGRSPLGVHLTVEALKHAFADRAGWLGDTDFVDVPLQRLTSEDYAAKLRSKIKRDTVLPPKAYGSKAPLPEDHGTTHVSIIDSRENMLSCTSTINLSFGSMVFVPKWGLIMNDEMGDFTAQPGVPNNYGLVGTKQNAVAPGKRPLSSMSPTLVLDDDGSPYMAVGASGGPAIITGTLMAMLNTIDFDHSPSQAIEAPRIHHQWLPYTLFLEDPMGMRDALEKKGHEIEVRPAWSNVQMVVESPETRGAFTGVSDPRKMGAPAAADTVDTSQ